jgi:hypothetical protein
LILKIKKNIILKNIFEKTILISNVVTFSPCSSSHIIFTLSLETTFFSFSFSGAYIKKPHPPLSLTGIFSLFFKVKLGRRKK